MEGCQLYQERVPGIVHRAAIRRGRWHNSVIRHGSVAVEFLRDPAQRLLVVRYACMNDTVFRNRGRLPG